MRKNLRDWIGTVIRGLVAVISVSVLSLQTAQATGGLHIHYAADAPEKMAGENAHYYDRVMHTYTAHTTWFDKAHPFYKKMFHKPALLEKLTARWEADEQRFEYWHWCLWKVLDGYGSTHPVAPTQYQYFPPVTQLPAQVLAPAAGGSAINSPTGPAGAVPEPSTISLFVIAMGFGMTVFYRRAV